MQRFLPKSLNQCLLAAIPLSLLVAWLTGYWTLGAAAALGALCVLAVRNPQPESAQRWAGLTRFLSPNKAAPQLDASPVAKPAIAAPPRRRPKNDSSSSPAEQMIAKGRVALLLRPQIASSLSPDELQTAHEALDEAM